MVAIILAQNRMRNLKSIKKSDAGARGGFTLIEVLVSMMIFLLAMGVVVQLFLFSLRSHRVLLAHSQVIGEMSYNLEHVSRGLRMAKKSHVGDPFCLSSPGMNFEKTATGIKFQNLNPDGTMDCVEYHFDHPADAAYPAGKMALMESRRRNGTLLFDLPLTSPEVNILAFSVADGAGSGWDQNDVLQPRVTICIEAQGEEGQILKNQVTISQRDVDVAE